MEGGVAGLSDNLSISLVGSTYTPSLSGDQYYNAISGGAIIAAAVALTSRTGAAGTLSADNVLFTSVSGSAASYIPLFVDSGTSSTSPLLGLIDTASGLPVTPNGGDITVAWSGGAVMTLFKGLDPAKEPGLAKLLWEWFNDKLGLRAIRGPGGLWLPEPRLVVSPRPLVTLA